MTTTQTSRDQRETNEAPKCTRCGHERRWHRQDHHGHFTDDPAGVPIPCSVGIGDGSELCECSDFSAKGTIHSGEPCSACDEAFSKMQRDQALAARRYQHAIHEHLKEKAEWEKEEDEYHEGMAAEDDQARGEREHERLANKTAERDFDGGME